MDPGELLRMVDELRHKLSEDEVKEFKLAELEKKIINHLIEQY